MTASDTVETYAAAWVETDEAARRALLSRCWAEDAVYVDPTARVDGREALVQHIGAIQREQPGHRLELASAVDGHGDCVRFSWRMVAADGSVALEGLDFGELDSSGRLRRIVGFFGPLPPKASAP